MRGHDIIVIGGSAGAFAPLRSLLAELPAELPAIVCVVLHRIPADKDLLLELFQHRGGLFVKSAVNGERPLAGTVGSREVSLRRLSSIGSIFKAPASSSIALSRANI